MAQEYRHKIDQIKPFSKDLSISMVVLGTKSTGQVFGAPVEIDRNGEIRNQNLVTFPNAKSPNKEQSVRRLETFYIIQKFLCWSVRPKDSCTIEYFSKVEELIWKLKLFPMNKKTKKYRHSILEYKLSSNFGFWG